MASGASRSFHRFLRLDQGRSLRAAVAALYPAPPLLRVEGLRVEKGGHVILQDISFLLRPGEWVAVLGASGCGKSTLLETIAGLEPFSGEITRAGEPVRGKSVRARVGGETQLLFQDPGEQIFGTSALADLLYLAPAGIDEAAAAEALRAVGLSARTSTPAWELSFGEKKRLALAGVLQRKPRLLLCDEPTAGLDPANIRPLVRRLEQESSLEGVLWVTHDQHQIPARVKRVILLHEGKILFDGPRAEALSLTLLTKANLHS